MSQGLLATAMILVFCGAIGKSAQVPLHVWLPSAMEGPTPVSALIHAATMVAAGVYMVARVFPLFVAAGPAALLTVAWVGGITALFAATIALVQSDFKRVLAFSTISQLGYMFVGLGVSGLDTPLTDWTGPGMFHLFTHAFFKALLFLGAGSVLHSLHHATHKEVQDMRLMGGLGPKMPITAITWLIATLSISGFPFFAGFFSKDTIIGLSLQRGQWALYIITLGTAGLTAFYMLRAFILAFGGPDGKVGGLWGGTYRGVGEPHESPATMWVPLALLAIPSIIAGYWFGFFPYVSAAFAPKVESLDFAGILADPLTWIGVVVSLVGLGVAYFMYARLNPERLHNFVENNAALRTIHRFLYNRYYVDDLYSLLIKYVVYGLSHIEQAFDTYVVDGIVNGVARLVTTLGRDIRYTETGRVQSYMVGFFGGIAILTAVVLIVVKYVR
jgi:proton-translocating NADH-quinone oxidoreductase chain L